MKAIFLDPVYTVIVFSECRRFVVPLVDASCSADEALREYILGEDVGVLQPKSDAIGFCREKCWSSVRIWIFRTRVGCRCRSETLELSEERA